MVPDKSSMSGSIFSNLSMYFTLLNEVSQPEGKVNFVLPHDTRGTAKMTTTYTGPTFAVPLPARFMPLAIVVF